MTSKVAVVTGSNKGIGYAIVKGLCEKFNGKVYLTARDETRGNVAIDKLKQLGLNATFHQLDINDDESVSRFKEHIKEVDGGIDILVNNAAIAFPVTATESFADQARETVRVNYFGSLRICEVLFPVLRNNAQVVNVSSSAGHLPRIPSENIRSKFADPNLTIDKLNDLMNEFVKDSKDGKNIENGWGNSAYVVSKVGLSALTIVQQRLFDGEPEKRNISVNSVHPGYVDTDMTNHKGPLTIEEGALAPLYLALDAHGLKGQYVWCDTKVTNWYST